MVSPRPGAHRAACLTPKRSRPQPSSEGSARLSDNRKRSLADRVSIRDARAKGSLRFPDAIVVTARRRNRPSKHGVEFFQAVLICRGNDFCVCHAGYRDEFPAHVSSGLQSKRPTFRSCSGLLVVLGGGLEPPRLAAYAPQTYVSAISPPERLRGKNSSHTLLVMQAKFRRP